MSDTVAIATVEGFAAELAQLREEVADARRLAQRTEDRGQVENLFNRYMYLHNHPYSPQTAQKLEPVPPVPHDTFTDTFA